jgi:4-hydroxy-tetrahydrodipicolinate synthase
MQLLFKEGNPVGIKLSLSLLNICGSTVRLPLAEGSSELRLALEQIQKEIGFTLNPK